MEKSPSTIRGLINDLTRTLTGSMVHMDNLLLHLDNDSIEFDDAWLANYQLERALEFFIELRSEYMIRQESINQKKTKSYKLTTGEKLLHNFNNLLAVVIGFCDMLQNDFSDNQHIYETIGYIYKSIQSSHYLLNGTICLSEHNVPINSLTLSDRKIKRALTIQNNKVKGHKRILLVEDNLGVKELISIVLRKNNYIVVDCSNGEKALAIFDNSKVKFALCIVDIGLPDIEGPDLVSKLLLKKPNTNVLFTSGYNEIKLKEHYPLIGQYPILTKPFRLAELLNKIRFYNL
jgi:CheY-like chemotaxis protein